MPKFSISKRMSQICRDKGITPYRWWKNTDISQSTFYRIYHGKGNPRMDVMETLCRAVDMDITTFFSNPGESIDIPKSMQPFVINLAKEDPGIRNRVVSYYEGLKSDIK